YLTCRPPEARRTGFWRMCWIIAGVAQLVERLICNQRVGGSSPLASSIQPHRMFCPMGSFIPWPPEFKLSWSWGLQPGGSSDCFMRGYPYCRIHVRTTDPLLQDIVYVFPIIGSPISRRAATYHVVSDARPAAA